LHDLSLLLTGRFILIQKCRAAFPGRIRAGDHAKSFAIGFERRLGRVPGGRTFLNRFKI
jgi:hypothetical protein